MLGSKIANVMQEKYLYDMVHISMKTVSVHSVIIIKANRMLRSSRKGVENKKRKSHSCCFINPCCACVFTIFSWLSQNKKDYKKKPKLMEPL